MMRASVPFSGMRISTDFSRLQYRIRCSSGRFCLAVAILFRSTTVSFLAGIILLVAIGVTDALTSDLKNEQIAAILDPFGSRAFALATKYWTVAERNTKSLPLTGLFLWNRLTWTSIGILIFGLAAWRVRLGNIAKPVAVPAEKAN